MEEIQNGTMDQEVQEGIENNTATDLPTVESPDSQQEFNLPDNAAERTRKEFEKLLAYNKELKAKVRDLENSKPKDTVVSNFKSEVSPDMDDYVDEEGNVDIAKLNQDLKFLKSHALEAKALAEDAKNTIEVEKAVTKHPYLDPGSSEYDPQFVELVKDRMARLRLEGEDTSLSRVADEVLRVYKPTNFSLKEKEEAVAEYKKSQVAKAQVGTVNPGRNVRVDNSIEDLKAKLYSYNEADRSSAIRERLKKMGY
jgi:hypothetical protein